MTTITLSRLKTLGSIDNPQASAMERALMHAIDSMPKGSPDQQITDADIQAFKEAFPGFGDALDAGEQGRLLTIFANASVGNPHNQTLIAAARAEASPYTVVLTDSRPSMATATAVPVFTVQPGEGVWQVAERVKAELGAAYPDVLTMPTAEVAAKLMQANGLAMNADGSYPALTPGNTIQIAPYADGAMDRVGALLEEVVKDLPEATKHMVLATLTVAVGIFLATAWLTPGPATIAVLTYLAGVLGEAFMVGAGVGLVTLIAAAAMGSGGLGSAYEIKSNPEVGKVGANMVTALAGPKAIEYAGKGLNAVSPYVKDALGKIGQVLKPAVPALETAGTLGADVPVVGRVGGRSVTLGAAPILPSGAKSIYMQVKNIQTGEIALMEITAPRGDVGTYVADLASGVRTLPQGYALPDDGLIYLAASADEGAPIFVTAVDQAATMAPIVFDRVGVAPVIQSTPAANGERALINLPTTPAPRGALQGLSGATDLPNGYYTSLYELYVRCGLTVRTYNCLASAGCKTLWDIVHLDLVQFAGRRNVGRLTIQEVRQLLGSYGLGQGRALVATVPSVTSNQAVQYSQGTPVAWVERAQQLFGYAPNTSTSIDEIVIAGDNVFFKISGSDNSVSNALRRSLFGQTDFNSGTHFKSWTSGMARLDTNTNQSVSAFPQIQPDAGWYYYAAASFFSNLNR